MPIFPLVRLSQRARISSTIKANPMVIMARYMPVRRRAGRATKIPINPDSRPAAGRAKRYGTPLADKIADV